MSTYLPILYALQSGKLKPEDFVEYAPDEMRNLYLMHGRCEYAAEFDLGWHAVIYKEYGVFLVSDQPTKAYINVTENGVKYDVLKKYAALYDNKQFNTMSVALTSELYEMIPENLRKRDICICSEKAKFRRYSNFKRESSCLYGRRTRNSQMYMGPTFGPIYYKKNMLPIIFIPPDTIVDIKDCDGAGTTNQKAFKLFPRQSKPICVSNYFLNQVKVPTWVPLTEAMLIKAIFPEDFVEYFSNKENKFYIKDIYRSNETSEDGEGWHPQLVSDENNQYVQIVSRGCEDFYSHVYSDIKNGMVAFEDFEEDNPIQLLKIYAKLNLKKIKMLVTLPNNVMVQVNHPEYDGYSLERAYKLKIENEN